MTSGRATFEITGRHVLIAMIVFFGLVIAVNIVFVRMAVSSFPGEKVKKSYYQGLNYNDVLDERKEQAANGWRLVLLAAPRPGTDATIELRLLTAAGQPVRGASITGEIVRPTTEIGRRSFDFAALGEGRYRAQLGPLDEGAWDLIIEASEQTELEPSLSARTRIIVR